MSAFGPLTKLSCNVTARSMAALKYAAKETGDTQTDTINRALQLYATVIKLHSKGRGWGRFNFLTDPPRECRVEINRPWWRFW